MNIRFKGGKTSSGVGSLCDTCRWATIIKGHRESEKLTNCSLLLDGSGARAPVPFSVADCSEHEERGGIALYRMEESAWIVNVDKAGRVIGFRPPKEQRDDQ